MGAPAKDFVPYSAVDNRDNHVADEEFDVEFFRSRWHRDPSPAEKGCMLSHVICGVTLLQVTPIGR